VKDCLIVGQANVGKTLFLINFAGFMGIKKLEVCTRYPDGTQQYMAYPPDQARKVLVDAAPHKTRCLHSLVLTVPRGKVKRNFRITDTCGLTDQIHQDEDVRKAMAQTLSYLKGAEIVLHMVDAAAVGRAGGVDAVGEIDLQVARFASYYAQYAMLANKMDLPMARVGLIKLKEEFRRHHIIPVSALEKRGFTEVKAFVARHL